MGLQIGALRRAGMLGRRASGAIGRGGTTTDGAGRLSECVEAAAGVLLVAAVGLAWPGHWGLLDVQPHPFWLVVLAIGVRYGLPASYVAGGLSAGGYLALRWSQPGGHRPAFGPHALLQPLLLLAGAVVIGEIAESRRRRLADAERRRDETAAALDDTLTRYRATLDVKAELEKRIVGQPATVMTLYETAKQLESLDRARLYPAILDLLATYLGVEACSLYLRDADGFLLRAARPGAVRPRRLDTAEGVIGQALRERRLATVRDRLRVAGPDGLAEEPALMAGPLLDREGGVAGLVVVERMPFLKFSPTSVRLCNLILDWASTALQNAILYEEALVRAVDHDLTGAYTASHTLKVLRDELLRARRYGLPFAVIVVQAQGLADLPEEKRDPTLRALGRAYRACLRAVDIVGHHAEPDTFVLALPMTPLEGARVTTERLAEELRVQGLVGLTLRVGLTSYEGESTRSEVYDPGAGAFLQRAASCVSTLPDAPPALAPATRDQSARVATRAWSRP